MTKTNPIILIKIGGSLITDKNKPFTLKKKALKSIAKEIKKAFKNTNKHLIIGHGAGSFAHFPAKKYNTINGAKTKKDIFGMAKVCNAACQLNRIVVNQLINIGLPAVSISPFSSILSKNYKPQKVFTSPIQNLLKNKALPVVYGDVICDTLKGCTIFSTERVLGILGEKLNKLGFKIEKIIQCGQTNGVYNADGKTIKLINNKNFSIYKKSLGDSGGIDVTGGMLHKVEQSLNLAKAGIPALIIDGVNHGTLSKAVAGKKVIGTKIEW